MSINHEFWWAGFLFLRKGRLFLAVDEMVDVGVYWDWYGFYPTSRPISRLAGMMQ